MSRRAAIVGAIVLATTSLAAGAAHSSSTATVPAGAVVRVGDDVITRATFLRWFDIRGRAEEPRRRARDYTPPRFTRCIANARKAQRTSRRRATTAQLRRKCRLDYEHQRDGVLEFLIEDRWIAGEAAELGIVVTPEEHEAAFQEAKRASFETEADFRGFLQRNHMTYADARFQTAYATNYERVRAAVLANVAPVTDADVAAHYSRHLADFVQPELRDLRWVLAKTRAQASAARRALERGQTWHHVARKHSIDRVSRNDGGLLRQVARGTLGDPLDEALFRAPRGKLRGPVKAQFGWAVFKVLKVRPASAQTLEQASSTIREQLTTRRQIAAVQAFETDLHAKWRARTTCRSGYVMAMCANSPAPAPAGAS